MDESIPQTKRRHYSAEEKQTILAAYEQRTTTQKRFCLAQRVSLPTLHSWIRKAGSREGTGEFVELQPRARPGDGLPLEIELRDGTVLRIAVGTDPRWLGQLLPMLRCGA
jgi:transposase-like protein